MSKQYDFQLIPFEQIDRREFDGARSKTVFSTIPWIEFVAEDSGAVPIVIRITSAGDYIGYFTGLKVKKLGIRILGSPFAGWSTCFMGIDTDRRDEKCNILRQLVPYLYKTQKAQYIEIVDRDITVEEARENGFKALDEGSLELPIAMDDAALFKQMKTDCRNFIRQFERRGARLEIAEPDDTFAEQYYEQLIDVFSKQGLVPTYSVDKVKRLLRHLRKSGEVLCFRVLDPDEKCIATSIFLGYREKCFFWGGASFRAGQHYRPNEYMIWSAIQYWRDQGCSVFDMVGIRDYKRKFGSQEIQYARLVFAKSQLLIWGRNIASKMFYFFKKITGFLKGRK